MDIPATPSSRFEELESSSPDETARAPYSKSFAKICQRKRAGLRLRQSGVGHHPKAGSTGGALWISSGGVTACFHPNDWHFAASNAKRITFSSGEGFSVIDGYIWAIFQLNGNGAGGLGTITSPMACG
jgi:hypothetical protein